MGYIRALVRDDLKAIVWQEHSGELHVVIELTVGQLARVVDHEALHVEGLLVRLVVLVELVPEAQALVVEGVAHPLARVASDARAVGVPVTVQAERDGRRPVRGVHEVGVSQDHFTHLHSSEMVVKPFRVTCHSIHLRRQYYRPP